MSAESLRRLLVATGQVQPRPIECGGCGRLSGPTAPAWRAYLGREDDDSVCIVVMCPECAGEQG